MNRFNIRVYGIWINESQQVLVSDERVNDFHFTKFPGGGLEFGEGIRDCLMREWQEELGLAIEVLDHLYTTDFFQISAFDHTAQIISVYYHVKPLIESSFDISGHLANVVKPDDGKEELGFRFIDLPDFSEHDVTLPIDKIVARMLTTKNESAT